MLIFTFSFSPFFVSYVERLNSLVLREEFSFIMRDLKEQISTLAAAGQGAYIYRFFFFLSD